MVKKRKVAPHVQARLSRFRAYADRRAADDPETAASLRSCDVAEVVHHYAAEGVLHIASGGGFGPCPVCECRWAGGVDAVGPCDIEPDRRHWTCGRCGATGDGSDLSAYVVLARRRRAGTYRAAMSTVLCHDLGVDLVARYTLVEIVGLCTQFDDPNQCHRDRPIPLPWIARRLGRCEKTVQRAIGDLRLAGVIETARGESARLTFVVRLDTIRERPRLDRPEPTS